MYMCIAVGGNVYHGNKVIMERSNAHPFLICFSILVVFPSFFYHLLQIAQTSLPFLESVTMLRLYICFLVCFFPVGLNSQNVDFNIRWAFDGKIFK